MRRQRDGLRPRVSPPSSAGLRGGKSTGVCVCWEETTRRSTQTSERGRFAFGCQNCRNAMKEGGKKENAERCSDDLFCISSRHVVG